jgi:GMP synthase-like glutamine amidotransferase
MRVLVFQHIDVEHPGSFRDFMAADGTTWDVVALDRGEAIPDSMADYDAMMVMGGPMDVWDEDTLPWLALEKQAIRDWVVVQGRPFLGICLGHQLLAEVIGGTVGLMDAPEVGVCDVALTEQGREDRLFGDIATRFACLQWHGAEVKMLPATAVVSAVNAAGAIEAFRYGPRAFGLQFHVEITPDTAREWGGVPAYRASLEAVMGADGLARLEREAGSRLPAFRAMARRIYANFVEVVEEASREASMPPIAAAG